MTAGPFIMFEKARLGLGQKKFDFAADSFYGILCDETQALDETFVGGSTNCTYADLTGELPTAGGYTVGGIALASVTWTLTGGLCVLDFDNPEWAALTAEFKYFVVRSATDPAGRLVGFVDLNDATGPGTITSAGADYFINVPATGAIDLDQI